MVPSCHYIVLNSLHEYLDAVFFQWVCPSSVSLSRPPQHQFTTPPVTLQAGLGEQLSPASKLCSTLGLCTPAVSSTRVLWGDRGPCWHSSSSVPYLHWFFRLKAKVTNPDFQSQGGAGHPVAAAAFQEGLCDQTALRHEVL